MVVVVNHACAGYALAGPVFGAYHLEARLRFRRGMRAFVMPRRDLDVLVLFPALSVFVFNSQVGKSKLSVNHRQRIFLRELSLPLGFIWTLLLVHAAVDRALQFVIEHDAAD